MADLPIDDLNIASNVTLITPEQLKEKMPLSERAQNTVAQGRQVVRDILDGKDHRLFVVIGPCSIHDVKAAHEYADRLKALAEKVSDTLFLVMRVYFEKPRTTVGWKGLINDPYLDDSFKIEDGLHIYASKGTLEALGIINLRRVHVFEDMNTSKYIIKGFKAQHNALEPLMFTIADKTTRESLVFITDSAYTDFIFNGFTYYLTESNYIAEYVEETREEGIYTNPVGHMSLENNIEMYKRTDLSNCQQIILVHISDTNGNPDRMVRELKEVTNCNVDYAKKGKVWDLKPTPF